MKTAVIHDWLYTYAGSERVLEAILQCLPVESIYTLVDFLKDEERFFLNHVPVTHSFLQQMPWIRSKRRFYLPLMPLAIESHDVSGADLVVSSSAAVAKGVITNHEQLHVCYCYSPARYAWDLSHQYLQKIGIGKGFKATIANLILHYFRLWDVATVNRVDHFVTLSHYISRRIKKIYDRESTVIYPPVDIDNFQLTNNKEDYYLTISRLVPYKNVDLIVEAFAHTDKKLIVVGEGPEMPQIKAKATRNIEILGYQPIKVVVDLMQRARAFVFAANEEFGIVSVEAQATGTPVIAYGLGGSLETLRGIFPGTKPQKGITGIYFREQTVPSLLEGLDWFERCQTDIDPISCRQNAERFATERFKKEFKNFIAEKWDIFQASRRL